MLVLGLTSIVCVPIFKIITYTLPPYVGMMLALGVVSVFAEIYSNREFELSKATGPNPDGGSNESKHHESPVHNALTKIELPSILFFLRNFNGCCCIRVTWFTFCICNNFERDYISLDLLMVLFGFASAVLDNVSSSGSKPWNRLQNLLLITSSWHFPSILRRNWRQVC